jgi:AcrR family transcriptional regulator
LSNVIVNEVDSPEPRRRSDGERSHAAILEEAAQLATVIGIDGLSIARLAEAVGMSKSGLFAHFGSKEELQIATIKAASRTFTQRVIDPTRVAPTGLDRLRGLAENFLRYLESTYPGGCFFASVAAELDTRPGPVRDLALRINAAWLGGLERAIHDAQAEGDIDPAEDPEQLAFELNSFLLLANQQFVVSRTGEPLDRARRAIDRRLSR